MAKYLIIVESPTKVKTIKKFLGSNYDGLMLKIIMNRNILPYAEREIFWQHFASL